MTAATARLELESDLDRLRGASSARLTQGFLFAEVQPILHVMFFQASSEQPEIHGSKKEKSAKDNNAS